MAMIEKYRPTSQLPLRWTPFEDVLDMQREINRLFGDFFGRGNGANGAQGTVAGTWAPPIDVLETENEWTVRAELPGMSLEQIRVTVEGNHLIIGGERELAPRREGEETRRTERAYGAFRRAIALPPTVDPENVEAVYRDGVLELTLAKRAEARPRQIEVKAA